MLDFQQKRKVRKMLYSRLTIFALFVGVFFLARATYHMYTTEQMSAADYAVILKNYTDLKTQQATLGSQISKLSTSNGQEEEIRTKFSVAKPNETVVTVIGSTSSFSTIQTTNMSLWQKFLNLFK